MQALTGILDSPAVTVFLGTLPVLGAIIRGLLQNDRRLQASTSGSTASTSG